MSSFPVFFLFIFLLVGLFCDGVVCLNQENVERMFTVITYNNGINKIVPSKNVKKRPNYTVYKNYEVTVCCENDESFCKAYVEQLINAGNNAANKTNHEIGNSGWTYSISSFNDPTEQDRCEANNIERQSEKNISIFEEINCPQASKGNNAANKTNHEIDNSGWTHSISNFNDPAEQDRCEANNIERQSEKNILISEEINCPPEALKGNNAANKTNHNIDNSGWTYSISNFNDPAEQDRSDANNIERQSDTNNSISEELEENCSPEGPKVAEADDEFEEYEDDESIDPTYNPNDSQGKKNFFSREDFMVDDNGEIEKFNQNPPKSFYNIKRISSELTHLQFPLHEEDMPVRIPGSTGSAKKYFCIYCKSLYSKLVLHLENMHKDEPDVKSFSILPKGCENRKKLIEIIRKKGCFEFNTNKDYNNGYLIVSRRPKNTTNNTNNYKVCPHCKGYFLKSSIRKHYPKCIPEHSKGDRSISIMGTMVHGQIHSKASEILRTVFTSLRNDDITRVIRYDELVIILGNTLCEKYRLQHMHKMIRAKMRLIGRFLLKVKEIDPEIKSYTDVFLPEKFDNALKAINYLGGLVRQQYSSPATAAEMGTMLKKSAKLLITLCIKKKNPKRKLEVEDFFKVLEEDLPIFVNKPVLESQLQQKRQNTVTLPTTNEVGKFNNFIETNRQNLYLLLQKQYTYKVWKELASFCLTSIQIFNRKRSGEVERIKIKDFYNHESIESNDLNELVHSKEKFSSSAKKYVRFVIRGKLARGVPVLLSAEMVESIELVLKHRKEAEVPDENPYLFGLPGNSSIFKHLSACDLMRRFAREAGINQPQLMRGTKLRKHIATQSAYLDIGESEVNDLANFLGHAEKIHREHYRIPIVAREIGRVSQILERGLGTNAPINISRESETNDYSISVKEIDNNLLSQGSKERHSNGSARDSWNENSMGGVTEYGRERCVSPVSNKKIQRRSWTTSEIRVAGEIFCDHIKLDEIPSVPECIIAITQNVILQGRTPSQLKAWVLNQVNKKKKKLNRTKARWAPEEVKIIKAEFKQNLQSEVLPGLKMCEEIRNKYQILKERNATSIKAWINNYLKRKNSH